MSVNVSPNFAFLVREFPHAAEGATLAERSINTDPRASCFHARHTLEQLVKRVYRVEMIIDQLTARGVIEPGALYEAPFNGLHAGGPDGLFGRGSELIASLFAAVDATQPAVPARAG